MVQRRGEPFVSSRIECMNHGQIFIIVKYLISFLKATAILAV